VRFSQYGGVSSVLLLRIDVILNNMALRKQSFAIGQFYHLYNRGTEKRIIFLDEQDHRHFLFLMYICNTEKSIELRNISENFDREETIVDIGAYCLMPNHFHILVREKIENGISTYMRKLLTAYSMYFNKKYERTGKLYESVFKSTHAGSDNYLKYLYSYMHLNPVKLIDRNWKENRNKNNARFLEYIFSYPYSSLKEYIDAQFRIIDPAQFPGYFKNPTEHREELFEWINFDND
jgi:putative transposase